VTREAIDTILFFAFMVFMMMAGIDPWIIASSVCALVFLKDWRER